MWANAHSVGMVSRWSCLWGLHFWRGCASPLFFELEGGSRVVTFVANWVVDSLGRSEEPVRAVMDGILG